MKSELKEHPPPNITLYRSACIKLGRILAEASRCKSRDIRKFVEKVRSARSKLFTFLMHSVDSTNNACESTQGSSYPSQGEGTVEEW